jgi:hypothetical protein
MSLINDPKWCSKIDKIGGGKIDVKSGLKMIKNGGVKIDPKIAKKWHLWGGSKMIKNRQISTSGTRDPKNRIFWNFAVFYKSSPLFDPQNRPP